MKRIKKVVLLVAAALFVCGAACGILGWRMAGGDWRALYPFQTEPVTQPVTQPVAACRSITVDCLDVDVQIRPTEGETGSVSFESQTGVVCTEEDGVLTVRQERRTAWQFGWFHWSEKVEILVPAATYEQLTVQTTSGDVTVTGLDVTRAEIAVSSGNVQYTGGNAASLQIESTSGNIRLKGLRDIEQMRLQATSGDITAQDCTGDALEAAAFSGDIRLQESAWSGEARLTTTSGDVELPDFDAGALTVQTTSGDVTGILRTPKIFDSHTGSGRIDVPLSGSGGLCRVETGSGDIRLTLKNP